MGQFDVQICPRQDTSNGPDASSAMRIFEEARHLKHIDDRLKNHGPELERTDLYFEADVKFLQPASLLEPPSLEKFEYGQGIQSMQIYSDTTNLFEYCAHEYERDKLMVVAALVHKCVEVTYMKVAYFKHSNASKDQHELKKSPRKKAKITLNRPNWQGYGKVLGGQCNSSCIRYSLVKHLRLSGYDVAVCSSKWQGYGKVPGGDHEYIDVVVNGNAGASERFIVDIDFRSHFEMAILNSLSVVYVGSQPILKQFLQIMADAAKCSLKQNFMPLPPWRSLSYLQAKWHSKFERKYVADEQDIRGTSSDHKQCIGHLRRLKSSLQSEIETERMFKPITNDNERRASSERLRPSFLSS